MPAARLEIIEAYDWYENEAHGLGRRFQDEVDFQVNGIATHPLRHPVLLEDVRRARLRRFPYGLFFRPLQDTIHVIACFHSSRDPLIWRARI